MRRPTLKAPPAMLRRAAAMYAPLDRPPVLPIAKPPANSKQTELLTDHRSIERKDVSQTN